MGIQTDTERVAHLLRRFGLGASESEIDWYGRGGWKNAIDRLLDYANTEEPWEPELEAISPNGNIANPRFAQAYWYTQLLLTRRPLQHKMALFWHDHFAVSAQKVSTSIAMHEYKNVLLTHGTGKFVDLLTEVSKTPAMLYWLDNQENIKGKPNENFAREIMELFTLGIGNYSEKDVAEAARAFTGWTVGVTRGRRTIPIRNAIPARNTTFYFDRENHDDGMKELLGNKGSFDGEDVVGILVGNKRTAWYVTSKLLNMFVYPNPEMALVDRFSRKFYDSGLDMKVLLRDVMTSDEFYSDKAHRAIIKSPVDFAVPTVRALGLGESVLREYNQADSVQGQARAIGFSQILRRSTESMGMELMYPPDVAGWNGGESWISTSTMLERIKWSTAVFRNRAMAPALVGIFGAGSGAQEFVDRMLSLLDVELPEEKQSVLVSAAAEAIKSGLTAQNVLPACQRVSKLVFGAPEYQFS